MTNDSSPLHSGSRWEPVAGPTEHLSAVPPQVLGSGSASDRDPEARGRRRRRGPVLAAFAAILTLGASTAGLAYVRAADHGTGDPATSPVSRAVDGAPSDGAMAKGDRGADDRGAGDRARGHDHRDDGDDHGRGDDHRSDDRDDDGQQS